MKILIVSATHGEIKGFLETLENLKCLEENFYRGFVQYRLIDILVTGVGAAATMGLLTRYLGSPRYDLVINVGICGSFRNTLLIGDVVNITSESWADLGAEDNGVFLDLFDLGILKSGEKPYTNRLLLNENTLYSDFFSQLPRVSGITVNSTHGNIESIKNCILKYDPDVESMESAAVFNYCLLHGINFQCIRSISNFVEPRNRSSWNVDKALANLTKELIQITGVIS